MVRSRHAVAEDEPTQSPEVDHADFTAAEAQVRVGKKVQMEKQREAGSTDM